MIIPKIFPSPPGLLLHLFQLRCRVMGKQPLKTTGDVAFFLKPRVINMANLSTCILVWRTDSVTVRMSSSSHRNSGFLWISLWKMAGSFQFANCQRLPEVSSSEIIWNLCETCCSTAWQPDTYLRCRCQEDITWPMMGYKWYLWKKKCTVCGCFV